MAGSIESLLLLQIVLCIVSSSPLYTEIDENAQIGTDATPLKVRDNDFIKSASKILRLSFFIITSLF